MAFENGINMFDTAEIYADGKSEEEMYVQAPQKVSVSQKSGYLGDGLSRNWDSAVPI